VESTKPEGKPTVSDSAKKEIESKAAPRPPIKTAQQRLRDLIRKEIAQEKLQDQLAKIQTLLGKYRDEWTHYDASAKSKTDSQKPIPPDFGALAHEYSMNAGETGLVSQDELRELDIGKSDNLQQRAPIVQSMFAATTLYKPDVSLYRHTFPEKTSYFVFWKIDDQPDHIPKWDDPGIRTEVLRVWKLNEARKLALARAEELKKEAAANSGKPLDKLGSAKKKDFTVLRVPEFSFLTQMYGQLQMGEVFGLEKIGADFMQKVFSLAPDQVDVATNLPKTEIYVIRAVEFTPFAELWSDFTSDRDDWSIYTIYATRGMSEKTAGLSQMIYEEQQEVSQAWLKKVYEDAGVKWEKVADQRSAPGQQGPGPSPIDDE
jgi:hypothetical protein